MYPRPQKVRRGSIALCGQHFLGLITEDEPQKVCYGDGTTAMAYVGIHLRNEQYEKFVGSIGVSAQVKKVDIKIGDKWSSRSPRIVGHIDDLDMLLRTMVFVNYAEHRIR